MRDVSFVPFLAARGFAVWRHRVVYRTLLMLAVLAAASAGFAAGAERVFTVRGVVRAPFADGSIRIQHDPIPGFMPAMTMPFNTEASEVEGLVPGDVVVFQFRVGEQSRALAFRKVGREVGEADGGQPAPRPVPASRTRLREGDEVPSFALTDQEGRPLTALDLRGKPTILTFIFTRCPVPEFCPLIGKKFHALQSALVKSKPEARLLSITIDPEHDTPDVLREYGKSLGADFQRWRFATGTPAQIDQLTKRFAVRAERNAGALDHTLATALIGPDGRVVEIWRGNGWKPEEIVAKVDDSAPGR